jgi:hypothetical protein
VAAVGDAPRRSSGEGAATLCARFKHACVAIEGSRRAVQGVQEKVKVRGWQRSCLSCAGLSPGSPCDAGRCRPADAVQVHSTAAGPGRQGKAIETA